MKRLIVAAIFILAVSPFTAAKAAIQIDSPWAAQQLDMTKPGGIFMKIVNGGANADKLLSVSTPVAKVAQLHNAKMKKGKMRMRRTKALEIAPGKAVSLKHDGLHIMLVGLKAPLKKGTSFPVTLKFEKAGTVEVQVTVKMAHHM